MKNLLLNDLLRIPEEEFSKIRVRLNTNNGEKDPIDVYKEEPSALLKWNYHNNKPYKEGQLSIGLVNMGNDKWLLFTVGRILKVLEKEEGFNGVQVEYETLEEYSHLYGRVIIEYHNRIQQLFRKSDILDELVVSEILPSLYTGFDFPGYDKVHLTYDQLSTIIHGDYPHYRNALQNQKAVYVQTDLNTGKLYIGSATSKNEMLLARWNDYIKNGHGGNEELKKLVKEQGFDYIKKNFTYSILEVFNSFTPDETVLERESYWKNVLDTRKHGYNKN